MEKIKLAMVSLPENEVRYPPIGLLRIIGYLKKERKDLEIKLIDNTFQDIWKELELFNPDVIGLTTFTSYYQDSIDFSSKMKKINPNIKIIVGGPHIMTYPNSLDKNMDYGVLGQGEKTTSLLLDAIFKNKSFEKIPGVIYRSNGKLKINKRSEKNEDFEGMHIIDYGIMHKNYWEKKFVPEICDFKVSTGMITSIGCPFNCVFCSVKACWGNIRHRSLDHVIEEIKDLYTNFGVRHIDFYDDLFAINKVRLAKFYELLKKEGLLGKLTFSCQARADVIDEELCILLNKLNIRCATFGFESGSDRILKYLKNSENVSLEKNKKAIMLCKKYNINVLGALMMANPGEKIEDMEKTVEFMKFGLDKGATKLWAQVLVPLPATEIWEVAKKRDKINEDKINWKTIHIHNKGNPMLLDDDVSPKEFLKVYGDAKSVGRKYVYRMGLKTIKTNPGNIFYFLKGGAYYLKRMLNFVKQ